MKKVFLITIVYTVFTSALFAQEQLITYHGQVRTLISDTRMKGNVLNGDTTSARRGGVGSMFLDLGITVKPNENFKLLAEFRMRNIIGQNTTTNGVTLISGNNLIDSRMIFRQFRAEGNIKQIIHYQVGDIDVDLTKYTLFRNPETYSEFESDIYKTRRAISHYENFQNGNMWRVQGASAKAQINVNGPIRRIDIKAFAARTRKNSLDGVPDRYLVGGKINIVQSKFVTVGGNWTSFFDVPGTGVDSLRKYNYNNQVFTGNYMITPVSNAKIEFNLLGELGASKNYFSDKNLDTTVQKKDFFIDAGLRALYKPKKIELTASYINVGQNFTSPGAQSLNLIPTGTPNNLGWTANNTAPRTMTVYDRYADENNYNQRLQTGLMQYLPVYGNVLPYGSATPNRTGVVFNVGRAIDTANVISFSAGGAKLSELVSEGDSVGNKLRNYLQLKGGIAFKLSKLLGFQKNITLSTGGRYENTKRGGTAGVNFASTLFDAGLTVEVFNGVSLIGGVKSLNGTGNEVITNRDIFGNISGYTDYIFHVNQMITSGALRFEMFKNSFLSTEYNRVNVTNRDNSNMNYSLGNLFINVTLRF